MTTCIIFYPSETNSQPQSAELIVWRGSWLRMKNFRKQQLSRSSCSVAYDDVSVLCVRVLSVTRAKSNCLPLNVCAHCCRIQYYWLPAGCSTKEWPKCYTAIHRSIKNACFNKDSISSLLSFLFKSMYVKLHRSTFILIFRSEDSCWDSSYW